MQRYLIISPHYHMCCLLSHLCEGRSNLHNGIESVREAKGRDRFCAFFPPPWVC
jgi:hypothetical protein